MSGALRVWRGVVWSGARCGARRARCVARAARGARGVARAVRVRPESVSGATLVLGASFSNGNALVFRLEKVKKAVQNSDWATRSTAI